MILEKNGFVASGESPLHPKRNSITACFDRFEYAQNRNLRNIFCQKCVHGSRNLSKRNSSLQNVMLYVHP